jgi:hypothetical protein
MTFTSSTELATALRRAEAAHGEPEERTGQRDADWSDWYAEYIVREQAGKQLPELGANPSSPFHMAIVQISY